MKTTTIECPECAGHGGEGVYCDECLSTGRLTVTGAAAEAIEELRAALAAAEQRVEAAEAKLVAVGDYAAYYAIAWEWFEADSDGPEPLTFAEWLDEQSEVQP